MGHLQRAGATGFDVFTDEGLIRRVVVLRQEVDEGFLVEGDGDAPPEAPGSAFHVYDRGLEFAPAHPGNRDEVRGHDHEGLGDLVPGVSCEDIL